MDNSGTRHARGCLIAARERLRAGSKHMATYEAVVENLEWSLFFVFVFSPGSSRRG